MRSTFNLMNLAFSFILISLPLESFACKPYIPRIESYLQDGNTTAMVFVGTVTSIDLAQTFKDGVVYDVKMKATRWFVGDKRTEVIVRAYMSTERSTDCAGIGQFRAEVGEQWFIFGDKFETKLNPDTFNSRKIENGILPEDFRLRLEQNGIHF
ncbi:hypothetical protein RF679_01100 [Undibacterium cyanobacteriorum]|uniref:Uncharacterized protein n=1 Tax=Undibacterium cyanobacteriorum TaxID=3073561 RepID=A0ABY9RJA2_9BURK|nr:hypothetical protein [Undibacterium sp. 20NA77.5]WMW80893.1 hypothetical protein RF679_01100 [Undibacterium sp. 20NA77.5]